MKNYFPLLALLAAAPLAARAQSSADNIQQGGAAMVERQAAAARTNAAPGYYSAKPSRAERKRTNARRKANNDAWEADKKAHGGTEMRPGGYRWDPRTKQMITPEGVYVGTKKTQPVKKEAVSQEQRELDATNTLMRLRKFNDEQEAARKKAPTKPGN